MEGQEQEKAPFDIDPRLKQEEVSYNGHTIKIEKMPSFISWRTFLDIRRALGVAYPDFGEQLEKLFRGQDADYDAATMASMFSTAIMLVDTGDILEIQTRVFTPLKIRMSGAQMFQPFELVVQEFYDAMDVFFIGELLVRCLVVNFFESLCALQRRWETEES